MLSKELKSKVIDKFKKSENDTGSSQVQIGILTQRISQISDHLKAFPKDKHSRFGLVKLVGKRKTFLSYLKKKDKSVYNDLIVRIKNK